jgi:hypothetical protein
MLTAWMLPRLTTGGPMKAHSNLRMTILNLRFEDAELRTAIKRGATEPKKKGMEAAGVIGGRRRSGDFSVQWWSAGPSSGVSEPEQYLDRKTPDL